MSRSQDPRTNQEGSQRKKSTEFNSIPESTAATDHTSRTDNSNRPPDTTEKTNQTNKSTDKDPESQPQTPQLPSTDQRLLLRNATPPLTEPPLSHSRLHPKSTSIPITHPLPLPLRSLSWPVDPSPVSSPLPTTNISLLLGGGGIGGLLCGICLGCGGEPLPGGVQVSNGARRQRTKDRGGRLFSGTTAAWWRRVRTDNEILWDLVGFVGICEGLDYV